MESTKLPWNQWQKSMAFHELPQYFDVGLFAINCLGNLKNAVRILRRLNRGFQGFSMANLEKGTRCILGISCRNFLTLKAPQIMCSRRQLKLFRFFKNNK